MFRKLKLVTQLLLLHLASRSQSIPFEQIPHTNPLLTDQDSILHEQVKLFFKKSSAPGLFIGISNKGIRSYYSYGYSDKESKAVFDPSTVFEAGSITKTFTANLLFQLASNGKINIEESISSYIPGVAKNDSSLSSIKLKDIASHTSGLPRLPPDLDKVPGYTLMQPYVSYNRKYLYAYLKNLKKSKPGTYSYSNLGFGLLSTIMEDVTGESYEQLLKSNIFQPLGMNESFIRGNGTHADSATGYFDDKPAAFWEFDCLQGAGALKITGADLLTYLEAHTRSNNKDFSEAVQKITIPTKRTGINRSVASGWHIIEDLKHPLFWHNGGTFGFSTFAAFEPTTQTSLMAVANAYNVNAPLDKLSVDLIILLMGQ